MIRDISLHQVKQVTVTKPVRFEGKDGGLPFIARHIKVTTPDGVFDIGLFADEVTELEILRDDVTARLANAIHGEAQALVRIADLEKELERALDGPVKRHAAAADRLFAALKVCATDPAIAEALDPKIQQQMAEAIMAYESEIPL